MSQPGELVPFVAASVEDAVTQVRARLGPSAVVVHVRKVPVRARGWFRKSTHRLEILAYRPETGGAIDCVSDAPAGPVMAPGASDSRSPAAVQSDSSHPPHAAETAASSPRVEADATVGRSPGTTRSAGAWRAGALLESTGLLAVQARRLEDELRRRHGERPPERLSDELDLVRAVLTGWWRAPREDLGGRPHLLVGAPGVGKTTCLCKWLTQVALGESRPARVWRLDTQGANTAEVLNVHCEILGVPVERCWRGDFAEGTVGEVQFIDVPGTDWRDGKALRGLAGQWERWGSPRVHLVVNAAYDVQVLLQQLRAFSILPIEDLIVTHLDEEVRWGKIWNLTLGTNFCVRYFSTGQNIPGEFVRARPELVFARQFPA